MLAPQDAQLVRDRSFQWSREVDPFDDDAESLAGR
jgi:hypothetical protein